MFIHRDTQISENNGRQTFCVLATIVYGRSQMMFIHISYLSAYIEYDT